MQRIHQQVRWNSFDQNWQEFLAKNRIGPEFYITASDLDLGISSGQKKEVKSFLNNEGLSVSVHGPFHGLYPGNQDEKIAKFTLERYQQAIEVALDLGACVYNCHPAYDWRHEGGKEEAWLQRSAQFFTELKKMIQGTGLTLCLENTFEEYPEILISLVKEMDSEQFKLCFDVGHCNFLAKISIAQWLERCSEFLGELHIHDNYGDFDDHLAIGSGSIDFESYFALVKNLSQDILWTLEMRSIESAQLGFNELESRYEI